MMHSTYHAKSRYRSLALGILAILMAGMVVVLAGCTDGNDDQNNTTGTPTRPADPRPQATSTELAPASPTAVPTPEVVTLMPLTDLAGGDYFGFEGGLYPGGSNEMPAEHAAEGAERASLIVPRDIAGEPSAGGKIVLLSIGIADAAEGFCGPGLNLCEPWTFGGLMSADPNVDQESLVLVNGAIYGRDTTSWDEQNDQGYQYIQNDALAPQGLSEQQVQAIWLYIADPNPGERPSLPDEQADAYRLLSKMADIVRALQMRYPNLQQVFISSRIYSGYAVNPSDQEPYAYESGLAVKWLIESQIRQMERQPFGNEQYTGDLRYGRKAPWLAWGPYLWANGANPRSDGLRWEVFDFEDDGSRPSASGEQQVGGLLHDFFTRSPFTEPWVIDPDGPADATPQGTQPVPPPVPTAISGTVVSPTPPAGTGFSDVPVPLIDLLEGTYLGYDGGLYSGSTNQMPLAHAQAGLARAQQIQPLDAAGNPSPDGKIVMLSVGMSNVAREFCGSPNGCQPWSFVGQAERDPEVNKSTLTIVNGARSGQDAVDWEQPNSGQYRWVRDNMLTPSGVTESQVQVIWMKQANGDSSNHAPLPDPNADAFILLTRMGNILRALKTHYPNLQMVFISSRVYAGYAVGETLNPEPYAYESGFAVKWLIDAQIQQMANGGAVVNSFAGNLDYSTVAPWIGWGPYMWANGTNPRSDGLVWLRDDFGPDGTHPFTSGNTKVATMLLDFFKSSGLTQCWFLQDNACFLPVEPQ